MRLLKKKNQLWDSLIRQNKPQCVASGRAVFHPSTTEEKPPWWWWPQNWRNQGPGIGWILGPFLPDRLHSDLDSQMQNEQVSCWTERKPMYKIQGSQQKQWEWACVLAQTGFLVTLSKTRMNAVNCLSVMEQAGGAKTFRKGESPTVNHSAHHSPCSGNCSCDKMSWYST